MGPIFYVNWCDLIEMNRVVSIYTSWYQILRVQNFAKCKSASSAAVTAELSLSDKLSNSSLPFHQAGVNGHISLFWDTEKDNCSVLANTLVLSIKDSIIKAVCELLPRALWLSYFTAELVKCNLPFCRVPYRLLHITFQIENRLICF